MFDDDEDLDGLDFGDSQSVFNSTATKQSQQQQQPQQQIYIQKSQVTLNNNNNNNSNSSNINNVKSSSNLNLVPPPNSVSKLTPNSKPITTLTKPVSTIASSATIIKPIINNSNNNNNNNNNSISNSQQLQQPLTINKPVAKPLPIQQQQPQQPKKPLFEIPSQTQSSQYTSDLIKKTDIKDLLLNHRNINNQPITTTNTSSSNNNVQNKQQQQQQPVKSITPPKQPQTLYHDNDQAQPHLQTPVKRMKNDLQNPVHIQQQQQQQQQQDISLPITPSRKFPGPAGSLPPLLPGQKIPNHSIKPQQQQPQDNNNNNNSEDGNQKSKTVSVFLKANLQDIFNYDLFPVDYCQGPWVLMLKQRGLPPFGSANDNPLLLKYNIDYVLREGYQKKVPLLVVMIKSLVATESNFETVISDPYGEMKGTIQKKIVLEHYPELSNGWILVLKKTSIFNPTPTSHYVNIVLPNIEYVFSPNDLGIQEANDEFDQLANNSLEPYDPKSIYQAIPIRTPEQIEKELLEKKLAKKLHAESLNPTIQPPPPPKKSAAAKNKPKAKGKQPTTTSSSSSAAADTTTKKPAITKQVTTTTTITTTTKDKSKNSNNIRDEHNDNDEYEMINLTPPQHSPRDIDIPTKKDDSTTKSTMIVQPKQQVQPILSLQSSQGISKPSNPITPLKPLIPLQPKVLPIPISNSQQQHSQSSSQQSVTPKLILKTPTPIIAKTLPKPAIVEPVKPTPPPLPTPPAIKTHQPLRPPSSYFATDNNNNTNNSTNTNRNEIDDLDFDFGDTGDEQPQQQQQNNINNLHNNNNNSNFTLPSKSSIPSFQRKLTPINSLHTTMSNAK
ncbi:hypothetical protein PPL_09048 [Heterostelium album PN500]|uniref:Homologous recombination OB-fold protein OB-fold domain-containing protein n=1 Tax=Heterostelium pallidum (strain ATCC 26659 / Pp 5 / PN500) TaxID=670386 RepID=D3BKG7_HETP5|nr:hypothetical protein PPL_09048 [Heterostelium album PN500]EFA78397.1 hypothetical protein PPL_09048 [Heterostelium album PN500]|eukprot:XP_020430522.1 hypothetical protein PPL_09048 [Heterostelium album PN500]